MSSAAMHLRSPINSSSDATTHSPLYHTPFNADALNASSAAAAGGRSRPRLNKLRKQSASQHARSRIRTTAADSGDSGFDFNPFRSDQVTANVGGVESGCGDSLNCHRRLRNEVFVFGARKNDSDSARDLNTEQGFGKGISEKETEFKKSNSMEFVFSAKRSDVESNSLHETEIKSSENEAKTVSGETLNSERQQGGFNFTGFVFSADRINSESCSNTEKGKSNICVGNAGLDFVGDREYENGAVFEKQDCFGENHSHKAASVNVKKQESIDSTRNSAHGGGAFKKETNCNCDKDVGRGGDDDKCKSVHGIINGISSAYSHIPAFKLQDEMKKLNINHSEGADITGDSVNSCVNSSAGFVFGVSDNSFGYSSVSSGTSADGQQSRTCAEFQNISGQYVKDCGTNNVQNGNDCGVACDSTGIPCSMPSTSQKGTRHFQCGKIPECSVSENSQVNEAATPFSSSSFGLDSHPNYYASMESFMDFKPPTWDPSCFKDNLFPKANNKTEPTQKSRFCKEKASKCRRRKSKLHSLNKKQTRVDRLSKENGPVETPGSTGCQSPMDFSPYQETAADDQGLKASEELNDLHSEIPIITGQRCGDLDNEKLCNGSSAVGTVHSFGPEIVWPGMKTEQINSNTERQKADIFFAHGLGDSKEKDFTFSASSTGVSISSSLKHKQKKKFRRKARHDSVVISPNVNGNLASTVQFSPLTTANFSSQSDVMDGSQINNGFEERDGTSSTIQEACYKWRLRGNHAHKDGDLSKAEDYYTQGIKCVPLSEMSGCCIKPLLLCYSNRAATRMSLGRIRDALEDCMMATSLDPTFLKVQMRTANCHLLLGEVENAQQYYNKCLESGSVVCLDRRVIVEAADGLQKAQEVVNCMNDAAELLKERTSDTTGCALELLTKALLISIYSEKLLQMKAEALCLLQKYEAAIQLCEQSQHPAEKNFALANSANNSDSSMRNGYSSVKLWRWSIISKCYFHLGRLEASLNLLEKLQQVVSVNDKCLIDNIEDLQSLATTIRELLDHKNAGNKNFKLGKYTDAVENYTVALSGNIKSRPFAAICSCNRAAAYQALGQISDAIADCSMAMALDGSYAKAISRRASLHEMVRDYEQAACDLRRLISVLETQSNEKAKQSGSPSGSNGGKESRQVHQRLLSVEEQAKKGTPLDFYLILGIKPADTATDIKKAYHKAALRHHPDKAGQLLPRSEVADEGRAWKEISQEVHKDADRLFKMIGEAYAVLSDPSKRSEYDLEEEIRKAYQQNNRGGTCRRSSDFYGNGRSPDGYKSPFDRTSNRRHGRDHWKTYGHSYPRW